MASEVPGDKVAWESWDGAAQYEQTRRDTLSGSSRNGRVVTSKRLLVALALAALTTGLQYCAAQSFFGSVREGSKGASRVAVAARDVAANQILGGADIEFRDFTGEQCLSSLVSLGEKSVLGQKMSAVSISAGSPLFRDGILIPSTRRALMSQVPLGKQLYALSMSDTRLAISLRAGDRIDVVGNLQLPEKGFVTRTLLDGVIVAGVEVNDGDAAVLLFLEKSDSEFLTHAKRFGDFVVLPRNAKDTSVATAGEGMTQTRFLDEPRIRKVYDGDLFQIKNGSVRRD